jgi:hypothetical protein
VPYIRRESARAPSLRLSSITCDHDVRQSALIGGPFTPSNDHLSTGLGSYFSNKPEIYCGHTTASCRQASLSHYHSPRLRPLATLESLTHSEYPVEEFELFQLPEPQYPYPQRRESGAREAQRERQRREKLEWLLQKAEMKFSHSLQFNAVPDWSSHYIAYSNLKKLLVARHAH